MFEVSKKLSVVALGVFALAVTVLSLPAFGQTAAIRGRVIDDKNAPVEGAEITITRIDIKGNYTVKTNKKGEYYHGGLPLGRFDVTVKKEGFQPDQIKGVRPPAGGAHEENFTLKPGSGVLASDLTEADRKDREAQAQEAVKQKAMMEAVKTEFDAGLNALKNNDYDTAVSAFKKAIEKDAEQPYVWANLATAYHKQKKHDDAIAAFEKAIALKADDPALLQNLGNVYAEKGLTEKAQEYFRKAADLNPQSAAISYYNLGVTFVNSGKSKEAAESFESSIKADPNYAESYYQMGICYVGLNKIADAKKAFEAYIKLTPDTENAKVAKDLLAALK